MPKSDLEKTFADVRKNIRMWATWKLKVQELDLDGTPRRTLWAGMSNFDQKYNLLWNRLYAIVHNSTLQKLEKIVEFAENL